MKEINNLKVLFIQSCLAHAVSVFLYIVLTGFGFEAGLDNVIHLFNIVIPLGLWIVICIIIGLPIRLIRPLRAWWTGNIRRSRLIILVGFLAVGVSLLPMLQQTHTWYEGDVAWFDYTAPYMPLAFAGWTLAIFGILHTPPPAFITKRLGNS